MCHCISDELDCNEKECVSNEVQCEYIQLRERKRMKIQTREARRAQVDQVSVFSFIHNNNCMFSEVINEGGNGIPSGPSQAQGQAGPSDVSVFSTVTLHLHVLTYIQLYV